MARISTVRAERLNHSGYSLHDFRLSHPAVEAAEQYVPEIVVRGIFYQPLRKIKIAN